MRRIYYIIMLDGEPATVTVWQDPAEPMYYASLRDDPHAAQGTGFSPTDAVRDLEVSLSYT